MEHIDNSDNRRFQSGYDGHLSKKETFQSIWSKEESLLHINVLEMEAVMLSIQHFLPKLVGKNVLIRSNIHTQTRGHTLSSVVHEN